MGDNIFEEMPKEKIAEYIGNLPVFEATDVIDTDFTLMDCYEDRKPVVREERAVIEHSPGLDSDFELARKNLLDMVDRQQDMLDDMVALARATDSPRAWEVVTTLMKTMTDINEKLLDLHDKKADIIKKQEAKSTQTADTITNNQFNLTLSTAEMLEMLKDA